MFFHRISESEGEQLSDMTLNYSVVFVEDDEQVREKVSSRLARFFKNVYVASDGEEGWSLYLKYRPEVLFLDINLPKLNGIELLKRVRKNDHNTKAVMLTAHSDVEFLLQTNELKLTKYIVKPLNRVILNETIELLKNEMNNFKTVSIKNFIFKDGYQWNLETSELICNTEVVHLTPNEKRLLEYFIRNTNITISMEDITILLWNSFEDDKHSAIKTLIKNLRRKLPDDTIENVFGEGYRITD